jgi:hypothetical protein
MAHITAGCVTPPADRTVRVGRRRSAVPGLRVGSVRATAVQPAALPRRRASTASAARRIARARRAAQTGVEAAAGPVSPGKPARTGTARASPPVARATSQRHAALRYAAGLVSFPVPRASFSAANNLESGPRDAVTLAMMGAGSPPALFPLLSVASSLLGIKPGTRRDGSWFQSYPILKLAVAPLLAP